MGDATYWEPWVRWALQEAGLPQPRKMRAGRDLSYPTFVCDTGVVVKLFSLLFAGRESHEAEAEAYGLLAGEELPVPRLVASGELYPDLGDWGWPYLIVSELSGQPYASVRDGMDRHAKERLAWDLGELMHRLHRVPLEGRRALRKDWHRFLALLRRRRMRAVKDQLRWGHISPALCGKLHSFLPGDPGELLDITSAPVFIHGDLHAEHIYVDPVDGRLQGIIDFTDVYAGDPRYELLALHLGSFGGDKELLSLCLEGYGWSTRGAGWAQEMLAFTLLHDFDVLAGIPANLGSLWEVKSPEALARLLWDVEAPGSPPPTDIHQPPTQG